MSRFFGLASILSLSLLCAWTYPNRSAGIQEPSEDLWGKEVAGLRMRLVPRKRTILIGEEIAVLIQVRNVSQRPITIFGHRDGDGSYPTTHFEVMTPQGQKVVLHNHVLKIRAETIPQPRLTLKPGEKLSHWVALDRWIPNLKHLDPAKPLAAWFPEPGDYTIRCVFLPLQDDFLMPQLAVRPRVQLTSQPLKIRIAANASGVNRPCHIMKNLLVNGSFEVREPGKPNEHIDTLMPGRTDLVGWEITGKSIDWIGPTRWKASHGRHCLDLDGGIRQTVRTVACESYEVQFDLAGNPELGPLTQTLSVYVDGRPHDFKFDSTGRSTANMGWTTKRVVFTANKASTSLTFLNTQPNENSAGVALDNVVLRRLELQQYPDKAEFLRRQPKEPKQGKELSRAAYLQGQINGLLKEAEDLRRAGRIKEAKQHEEKAQYRRKQLLDLQRKQGAPPRPPEAAEDDGNPDAAKLVDLQWRKPTRHLAIQ